jgi:hypothetical protein
MKKLVANQPYGSLTKMLASLGINELSIFTGATVNVTRIALIEQFKVIKKQILVIYDMLATKRNEMDNVFQEIR